MQGRKRFKQGIIVEQRRGAGCHAVLENRICASVIISRGVGQKKTWEAHGTQKSPLLLTLDTVFTHLGIEGAAGDAQFFGSQGQIAADAFKGAANKSGLGLGESA